MNIRNNNNKRYKYVKKSKHKKHFTIVSAALQDKWMRDMKLSVNKDYLTKDPTKYLTLAQKIGVEILPPSPISDEKWDQIILESRKREDCKYPCPICRDKFGLKHQIILSCGHVFHKNCLLSFEKYNKERICPLCRTKNYQKKTINDGKEYYTLECYTLIQSWFRYIRQKKEYIIMQNTIEPRSPSKKQKFLLRKYKRLNNEYSSQLNKRENEIDALINNINNNLSNARYVFGQLDAQFQHEFFFKQKIAELKNEKKEDDKILQNGKTWKQIRITALNRNEKECPICMEDISPSIIPNDYNCNIIQNNKLFNSNNQNKKDSLLLSCSHVFHKDCIKSFERFSLQRTNNCPICRSQYQTTKF